jgi:adenosylhomocysteine nucleosidase
MASLLPLRFPPGRRFLNKSQVSQFAHFGARTVSYLIQLAMKEELQSLVSDNPGSVAVSIGIPKPLSHAPMLDIVVTGVGKVAAASVVSSFLAVGRGKSGVVSAGYCGALSQQLRIGDVFVPTALFQFDYGAQTVRGEWLARPGERTLQYEDSPFDGILFRPDDSLVGQLLAACSSSEVPVVRGVAASGDRFITVRDVTVFREGASHADAIDMESAAVAQACELHGTPFASVRVVSDSNNQNAEAEYLDTLKNPSTRYKFLVALLIRTLLHLA